MIVTDRFISKVVDKHGRHPVSTDVVRGILEPVTLKLKHHIHSSYEGSIVEGTMQYIKDRTEGFDDYFPCRKKKCKLEHVIQ